MAINLKTIFPKLLSLYRSTAILALNTFLLFAMANVAAYLLMRWFPEQMNHDDSYLQSLYQQNLSYFTFPEDQFVHNRAFLRKIYPGYSDDDIDQLIHPPSLRAHPTLEFVETPTVSKYYHVGFENMRYTRFVHAGNAADLMNGTTWFFSGSTGFGHGVGDDETIAAYLNALDSSEVYLNFSVQAYHQNSEIEKLLLLLKKGYRPRRVIFLDGLNDITTMRATNFHPAETPARNISAYSYIANIERLQRPHLQLILGRLPLFALIFRQIDRHQAPAPRISIADGYEDIYAPDQLYHRSPIRHYQLMNIYESEFDSVYAHIERYQEKLLTYYRLNSRMLAGLAEAFGFDYAVFFQPLGYASLENPFVIRPEAYRESAQYRTYQAMRAAAANAIRDGEFPNFYDISDADDACPDCYVDLGHYNPHLNRIIAQRILDHIKETR